METTAQIRKWGRSLGIVIPKELSEKANLKEGKKVRIFISETINPISKTFGTIKLKKTTEKIMEEINEESWDE